jgi:transcriptional regulator with XRE-family HTH domain
VTARPYPFVSVTLGDYLRKKRLDLNLRQKDLACIFNATDEAINYWENNLRYPSVQFLAKIIQFIGYCPYEVTLPIANKLVIWRNFNGLSQKQMAILIGIDASTLGKWEQGTRIVKPNILERIKQILSSRFCGDEGRSYDYKSVDRVFQKSRNN